MDFYSSTCVVESIGRGFWKVFINKTDYIVCTDYCLRQVKVLVTASISGHNIVKEEIDVSAFIKIHRITSLDKCIKSLPLLNLSVRKDPEAIEFVESWPLANTILNSSLPVIPLIFQAKNLTTISNTTFWLVVVADFFSEPMQKILDFIVGELQILVQKVVSLFPAPIRVFIYFFLYSLNKNLVSCNFITNKREPRLLDEILCSDESVFYNTPVLGVEDMKKDDIDDCYSGGKYCGDGFMVEITEVSQNIADRCYNLKILLFRLKLMGGYSLVKEGIKESLTKPQMNCLINCLDYMSVQKTPPIKHNFRFNLSRMHCFDIERVLDLALNSETTYYKLKLDEDIYEIYERIEITLNEVNYFFFKRNSGIKGLKILLAHNQKYFGVCVPNLVFHCLKSKSGPSRFFGIGNSELKLYLSDFNKLLKSVCLREPLKRVDVKHDSGVLEEFLPKEGVYLKIDVVEEALCKEEDSLEDSIEAVKSLSNDFEAEKKSLQNFVESSLTKVVEVKSKYEHCKSELLKGESELEDNINSFIAEEAAIDGTSLSYYKDKKALRERMKGFSDNYEELFKISKGLYEEGLKRAEELAHCKETINKRFEKRLLNSEKAKTSLCIVYTISKSLLKGGNENEIDDPKIKSFCENHFAECGKDPGEIVRGSVKECTRRTSYKIVHNYQRRAKKKRLRNKRLHCEKKQMILGGFNSEVWDKVARDYSSEDGFFFDWVKLRKHRKIKDKRMHSRFLRGNFIKNMQSYAFDVKSELKNLHSFARDELKILIDRGDCPFYKKIKGYLDALEIGMKKEEIDGVTERLEWFKERYKRIRPRSVKVTNKRS